MKNKILLFIGFIFFCACSQSKFTESQIKNLNATLSYLDMTNNAILRNINTLEKNIKHHHRENPHKIELEIEIKNSMEFISKMIGFIYKYNQEHSTQINETQEQINHYNNILQTKTFITQEKSNEIANMLIKHLEDLQKKYNNLRTDTLFKGFLKKENKQDFFYEYYFENTSVVESLISLEEIIFVLMKYQEECLYIISHKYLEKGNITRIEILNKKEKYHIGDTIFLGLKGGFPKITRLIKVYSKDFPFDNFPKNNWYYVVPKNIHIGKNDLYTNIKCMRENQKDTMFFRNFPFEVINK